MTLRIFPEQGPDRSTLPIRRAPYGDGMTVAVGGTSATSEAIGKGNTVITLQADEDCHIRFSQGAADDFDAEDATTDCYKLTAGVAEDFSIPYSSFHKVAVIAAA